MIRATTPIIEFIFPEGMYEMSKEILITFKQGNKIIFDKHKEDLIEDTALTPGKYYIKLTQNETNMFLPNISLKIQVRFLTLEGDALASKIKEISVHDVLNDEELI